MKLSLKEQARKIRSIMNRKEKKFESVFPFGKFAGTPITEVPKDYLIWVKNNIEVDDKLAKEIEEALSC